MTGGPVSIEFEEGSGNVFVDLGFDDADERLARAELGRCVLEVLTESGLEDEQIATLLDLGPTDVAHLFDGHFSRFSTDALLDFLKRLDRKVTLRITPRRPGEPSLDIAMGP